VHEGKFSSPYSILQNAKDQMEAHMMAERYERDQQQSLNHHIPTRWMTPLDGFHKVNSDVSVDKIRRRVSFGVIIRNEEGPVRAMLCETKNHIQDPAT
jgi:hypothetical protein